MRDSERRRMWWARGFGRESRKEREIGVGVGGYERLVGLDITVGKDGCFKGFV